MKRLEMRVLYFSRNYTTHDYRFLSKLAESTHEVWFLQLQDDALGYEQRSLPARVRSVVWSGGKHSTSTLLALMPEFSAILNQLKPDVIHAGPVQSCGFMTAMAGARPFLIVSWGSDILVDSEDDEQSRWMTRYALEHSDMLLCDCDAVRKKVQQILPYADNRIVQFPWGIDLQQFSRGSSSLGIRSRPGWKDAFIILSTRSWEPIYGIDVLLSGFAEAHSYNRQLRLILLGNGSGATEIDRLIHRHGLDDAVLRPGRISQLELPQYFRIADLYASCAHSDGSSVSLLEAMATGLPVLVTDGPGNREWVVQNENGWLIPKGDVHAVSECILRAASLNAATKQQIAERNRDIVETRANWNKNCLQLLRAYELLVPSKAHETAS